MWKCLKLEAAYEQFLRFNKLLNVSLISATRKCRILVAKLIMLWLYLLLYEKSEKFFVDSLNPNNPLIWLEIAEDPGTSFVILLSLGKH